LQFDRPDHRTGPSAEVRFKMNVAFRYRQFEAGVSQPRQRSRLRRDIRIIRGCAVATLVVIVLAASVAAGELLAPTAIAATLALVLTPVTRAVERLRIGSGAAAVLTVLATVACLSTAGSVLAPDVRNWLNDAPKIAQSIEHKLQPIARRLAPFERVTTHIAGGANSAPAPQVTSVALPDGIIFAAARTAPGIIAKSIYVTVLTIFLLSCRKRYTSQLILLPRSLQNRVRIARICRDIRSRVSGYLFTLSLINIGLIVITTVCFSLAGIANPLMWGIVFGVLNYIPILGPTSTIVASALFGFASATTIAGALAPPLILLTINTLEANLVQPWLLSRRIVVSPVAIFLTVATLVWMWGPLAAITAVPILISFHTVAVHIPALRPVGLLMASEEGAVTLWKKTTLMRRTLRTARPVQQPPA
jgi:predicted PurR-regulated permease PerM